MTSRRLAVLPIIAAAAAALASGVWAGLARLGISIPGAEGAVGLHHGGLMVGGFVATVIAVERAVSSEYRAAMIVPAVSAGGAVALLIGLPDAVAPLLFTLSGAGLLLLLASFLRRQVAVPLVVMTGAAAFWVLGNLAWLNGWSATAVLPWWMAFLVLTIAGERLELTRFQHRSRTRMATLAATLAVLVVGVLANAAELAAGIPLLGAGLAATGTWLLASDTAGRTISRGGVATYAAIALLCAYAWLVVAGVAVAGAGLAPGGWMHDTVVHAFFLGFVFGAIFAHAPIIFPAITGVSVRLTPAFYVALAVLHGSLVVRVASAFLEHLELRQASGALNGIALLLLAAAMVIGVIAARAGRAVGART
jgi:hypothetical protein